MAQQGNETVLDEAKSLLVQGKRFMALEDFQSATDCLEQSCQLFDAFYGVAKRECADAYFEYGLALVALANLEAGSGTDRLMRKAGIEEEDEEEEEGEEDGDEEQEDEDGGENEEVNGEEQGNKVNGNKADEKKDSETNGNSSARAAEEANNANNSEVPMEALSQQETTSKTNGVTAAAAAAASHNNEPQPSSSSSSALEPTPGTSLGGGGSGDNNNDNINGDDDNLENEEATTIEIAWEVLCLAKRLFMTDESLEGRLKLAETLQKIGEISIEWENNENAVSILEECLKIREAILKADDRIIADTYFYLGLAHSYKSDTQKANESFQNAINVIEKRIKSLSDDLEKAKVAQDTVAIGAYQKEINELKEILPDMTMRLDDSKEDDNTKSTEVLKRTREEMQQEDEEAKKVCLDKSKPVDDISHLVKRKAA